MDVIPLEGEIAVRVEDLSYAYPDGTRALKGVSLLIRRGESVGILGPNGAGKSTLAMHLNGILTGDGLVKIMGVEVNKKNIRKIRSMVGLVFQDPDDQLFSPTVRDDVAFGPLNQKLEPGQVNLAVTLALDWVGMSGQELRSPHHMSFGEKKRVALATVLSMEPEVLVLDEPVSNLDPRGRRSFIELIKTMRATKVIVTHDLMLAREVCGSVIVMEDGKVVAEGRTERVLGDGDLLGRHGLI